VTSGLYLVALQNPILQATPATDSQDKADGNELVNGDDRTDRETGTRPAWKTIDTQHTGLSDRKGTLSLTSGSVRTPRDPIRIMTVI
jgi:hypothetical protein